MIALLPSDQQACQQQPGSENRKAVGQQVQEVRPGVVTAGGVIVTAAGDGRVVRDGHRRVGVAGRRLGDRRGTGRGSQRLAVMARPQAEMMHPD